MVCLLCSFGCSCFIAGSDAGNVEEHFMQKALVMMGAVQQVLGKKPELEEVDLEISFSQNGLDQWFASEVSSLLRAGAGRSFARCRIGQPSMRYEN